MMINDFILPLDDDLLMTHDFFCLYPFDGGGRFIHETIIGALSNAEIFNKIINKNALHEFGNLPKIDFAKFEKWRTIEKSCWLNRFYFIVPLALESRLRQCKDTARLVVDTMLYFIKNFHPPQGENEIINHQKRVFENRDINYNGKTYDEYSKDDNDVGYIWFDFQPASRIIHFIYALYFLKGFNIVSEVESKELEMSIKLHADVIATQEAVSELHPGNHQSLRGLALLYAAAFFRGNDFAEIYLKEGLRVCNYHIENDYFDDGVLKEISPSYHVFETWHLRDAYLLSEKYEFPISKRGYNIIGKAATFVKKLTDPNGLLPVMNDGYALALDAFLESMKPFSSKGLLKSADYFKDAQIAFYKDVNRYLLMDFSVFPGDFSHYHGGKNSFVYWSSGKPFFIDSGCCSYDDPLFAEWYKTAQAHSTLLVGNNGDGDLKGTYEWIKYATSECTGWTIQDGMDSISSRLTSTVDAWNAVAWERSFKLLTDNGMIIYDRIEAPLNKELCLLFNLHPDVDAEIKTDGSIELSNTNERITLDIAPADKMEIKLDAGMAFDNFRHVTCKRLLVRFKSWSNDILIQTEIKRRHTI